MLEGKPICNNSKPMSLLKQTGKKNDITQRIVKVVGPNY